MELPRSLRMKSKQAIEHESVCGWLRWGTGELQPDLFLGGCQTLLPNQQQEWRD